MAATSEASSSPFHNIVTATSNATSHLAAFPGDLAHFLANAASFAFIRVPERIDNIIHGGGSMIAEATANESNNILSAALSRPPSIAQASNTSSMPAFLAGSDGGVGGIQEFGSLAAQHMRSLGGFFSYVTSKWALATTILVGVHGALILNRTQIYASMRRSLRLTWHVRLALRLAPILMFLSHTLSLLQAIRCQTSPKFSYMKYGDLNKSFALDFSGDGGIMYWLTSKILFLESEEESCLVVDMIPPSTGVWHARGSLSLLWPLFQALWLGQFVETISTVLQGRSLATETGMSIFEHSLAFAEAEGTLSNILGLSPLRSSKSNDGTALIETKSGLKTTRALLQQVNTPPENLLIALISALNNLSSQVLGVFDKQAQFRLINTGAWGLCYLAAFTWGFYNLKPEAGPDRMLMRFPVVCIVGFTPHLLILVGILVCLSIYVLALTLCFLSPPAEIAEQPFSQRLRWAYENMQAHAHFSSLRIDMGQDFYTALLQTGFMALTVASEAVFLNERQKINVARWTWLEKQRLEEFEEQNEGAETPRSNLDRGDAGDHTTWRSGYGRMKVHKISKSIPREYRRAADADSGVGAFKRVQGCINVYFLFAGIFWLLGNWMKLLLNKILDKVGISQRPQWLRMPKSEAGSEKQQSGPNQHEAATPLQFWVLSDDGRLSLPTDDTDIEQEMKRRLTYADENEQPPSEEQLSTNLYDWWKHGGWFGQRDETGSYAASAIDEDDITSVTSSSTTTSSRTDCDSESLASGRTTPTKTHPHGCRSRSTTPSVARIPSIDQLDPNHLASLLDPKDASTRQEAKMLAHHLTAPGITTRSRYAHAQTFANAKVLTSTRFRPTGSSIPASGPLSPDEEARLLEHLILSRRTQASSSTAGESWGEGGLGMGSTGPSCVVCQSAPRTVLAWPCRCLSLCEECRVSLAMNNFGTCVCCRQDVVGFSRLFVP